MQDSQGLDSQENDSGINSSVYQRERAKFDEEEDMLDLAEDGNESGVHDKTKLSFMSSSKSSEADV